MTAQTTIGSVAAVLPGYSVKGRVEHDPEGKFQVVLPRHLGDEPVYHYKPEDETRMNLARSPGPYLVHQGDVLFVSRGTSNRAAWLAEVPNPAIATSVFYILRAGEAIDPRYLAWYLNQTQAQAAIAAARTGAGTPIVQRQALAALAIPLPGLETQQRVAELSELMLAERRLRARLLEQTEIHHRLIGQKLVDRLT